MYYIYPMTQEYDDMGGKIRYKYNKKTADDKKRTGKTGSFASFAQPLLGKALGKRGISDVRIISNWADIVGVELSKVSAPTNITYKGKERTNGTLHISVVGAYATEMSYQSGIIAEKVNSFIGYGAVADIKLKHDFVIKDETEQDTEIEIKNDSEELKKMLSSVDDEKLKDALHRLGRHIVK